MAARKEEVSEILLPTVAQAPAPCLTLSGHSVSTRAVNGETRQQHSELTECGWVRADAWFSYNHFAWSFPSKTEKFIEKSGEVHSFIRAFCYLQTRTGPRLAPGSVISNDGMNELFLLQGRSVRRCSLYCYPYILYIFHEYSYILYTHLFNI